MRDEDKTKEQLIRELKEIRNAEAYQRLLLENISDIIAIIDRKGKIIYHSPSASRLLGYSCLEQKGQNIFDFIHPDDLSKVLEVFTYTLENPGLGPSVEYRCRDCYGLWHYLEGTTYSLFDNPQIQGLIIYSHNISERKKAEEKLKGNERFLASVFESIQDGIAIMDCDYNIVRVNTTMEKWYSDALPLIGKKCYAAFHGTNHKCADCQSIYTRETGQVSRGVIKRRDEKGNIIQWLEFHVFPLLDWKTQELEGVIQTYRDITEQQKMQQEMERFERLNLVGKMAAGLGHEVRNPMTTVRGYLQLLMNKKEFANFQDQCMLMIEELDRANSIISEFLSLASNRRIDLVSKNLNDIITALAPLIEANANVFGYRLRFNLNDIPNLMLDEKEIRQLLLNLIRNGLESMEGCGMLIIRTYLDGEDVVLAVQDQGSGISTEDLEKIGTPFFTTKEEGTGLGLAVCFTIARRHNAVIKVNTDSTGTTFNVRFKDIKAVQVNK